MSSKYSSLQKQLYGPPQNKPWVWMTTEMLYSDAWQSMSINCRRLIDFLLIEHRNHAGRENGHLIATYNQLEKFGLTRSKIKLAIREAEFLGFIKYKRGAFLSEIRKPNRYKLTFFADKEGGYPTNDWKKITKDNVQQRHRQLKKQEKIKKNFRKEFRKSVIDITL